MICTKTVTLFFGFVAVVQRVISRLHPSLIHGVKTLFCSPCVAPELPDGMDLDKSDYRVKAAQLTSDLRVLPVESFLQIVT